MWNKRVGGFRFVNYVVFFKLVVSIWGKNVGSTLVLRGVFGLFILEFLYLKKCLIYSRWVIYVRWMNGWCWLCYFLLDF